MSRSTCSINTAQASQKESQRKSLAKSFKEPCQEPRREPREPQEKPPRCLNLPDLYRVPKRVFLIGQVLHSLHEGVLLPEHGGNSGWLLARLRRSREALWGPKCCDSPEPDLLLTPKLVVTISMESMAPTSTPSSSARWSSSRKMKTAEGGGSFGALCCDRCQAKFRCLLLCAWSLILRQTRIMVKASIS